MADPVLLVATGHSYDRACILEWFRHGHSTDPKTNQKLKTSACTTNWALRSAVRAWAESTGVAIAPLPMDLAAGPPLTGGPLLDGDPVTVLFCNGQVEVDIPITSLSHRIHSIDTAALEEDSSLSFALGSAVWAPWQGSPSALYPGHIVAKASPEESERMVAVSFDDGDYDGAVPLSQVYPRLEGRHVQRAELQVGSLVVATYRGSMRLYPGKIVIPVPVDPPPTAESIENVAALVPVVPAAPQELCIVAYDDGDFDEHVPASTVRPVGEFGDADIPAGWALELIPGPEAGGRAWRKRMQMGTRVFAPWHDSTRLWSGRRLTKQEAWADVRLKIGAIVEGFRTKSGKISSSGSLTEAYAFAKMHQLLLQEVSPDADVQLGRGLGFSSWCNSASFSILLSLGQAAATGAAMYMMWRQKDARRQ